MTFPLLDIADPVERPEDWGTNVAICVPGIGTPFNAWSCLAVDRMPDLGVMGGGTQCFPRWRYRADGSREDNLRLDAFPGADHDTAFAYVYGVLHVPEWRSRFRDTLRRELPRIPVVLDRLSLVAEVGRGLLAAHLGYESARPYRLTVEGADRRVVKRMRVEDGGRAVRLNDTTRVTGIPPGAWSWKVGDRSPLEWVIAEYRVHVDPETLIVNDGAAALGERAPEVIGQMVTTAMESALLVRRLAGAMGWDGMRQ